MKILITGGAGYIGSHTARFLANKGHAVAVYDSLEKGHSLSLPGNIPLVMGNIADSRHLGNTIRLFRPDTVIHFAGYIEVGESKAQPQKYFENNLIGSISLVETMLRSKVRSLVFSSTAAVYGQPERIPITEDAEKKPTNNYGLSKLLFEEYLDSHKDLNSVCLRYFNAAGAAYGIGEDHNPETHLIPLILKTALGQNKEIKIFGNDYDTPDGTCVRDYVHVLDLAEAHALALDVAKYKSEKYNLGTGKGNSVLEIIKAAEKITRKKIPKTSAERREGDPAILVASYEKIKQELSWRPRRDIEQIIRSAWRWHSKNPNGYTTSDNT